jgi:hypothetical protein
MNIYETSYFILIAPQKPNLTRTDGGHLIIIPKREISDRT